MNVPNLTIEINASAVAWYGAILATGGSILSVCNFFRDKAKIEVGYSLDNQFYNIGPPYPYKEKEDYICVTVINKGRRPVIIEKASLRVFGTKGYFLLGDSFADFRVKLIDEKNPQTNFFTEQSTIDIKNVIYAEITDGTGKKYRKYLKKFPTVLLIIDWLKRKLTVKQARDQTKTNSK